MLVIPACLAWVAYQLWPDQLYFEDGVLVKKQKWTIEKMPITDLARIEFHYHAVVGFACVWEFISKSGHSIFVSRNSIDKKLASMLENHLPNFSSQQFYDDFGEGDIEDSLVIWAAE